MSTRGISAALNKSVPFGLPKAQVSEEFIEAYKKWKREENATIQAIKEANVKKTTF